MSDISVLCELCLYRDVMRLIQEGSPWCYEHREKAEDCARRIVVRSLEAA